MSLKISEDHSMINISQEGLIQELVTKYLVSSDECESSTASANMFSESTRPATAVDRTKYLSALMTTMYVARLTRPDILLATTHLATKSQNPTTLDWKRIIRIVKFLNGTKHHCITISCKDINIIAYCHASYASHSDGKSHT